MPVTLDPTAALTSEAPEPDPALMTFPPWFTVEPDTVTALAVPLLLARVRSPVPLVPPDRVRTVVPRVFETWVPPLFTASDPLTVRAEVVELWVTADTADPTAALIVVAPVPPPLLVIVPV